jgi:ferredoxin
MLNLERKNEEMIADRLQAPPDGGIIYWVVGKCDGCRLCGYVAINNFAQLGDLPRYRVVKQPEGWEELEQCQEAYERCPYHSIERTGIRFDD